VTSSKNPRLAYSGVGQAGGRDYSVSAAEEVPDLDGDEGYEKQIEQAQDGAHLADAEREDIRAPHGQVNLPLREQRDPQRARGDPGEHQGEEEMSQRLRHVETEDVREEALEDGIGGRKEGAEEKQERGSEQNAAHHGEGGSPPPPSRHLTPFDLARHHGYRSGRAQRSRVEAAQHVLRDAGEPQSAGPGPQQGEGGSDDKREEVQGRQRSGVPPGDAEREQHRDRDKAPPLPRDLQMPASDRDHRGAYQRSDPQEEVDPPRRRSQQPVSQQPERQRPSKNPESEPRLAIHPRTPPWIA